MPAPTKYRSKNNAYRNNSAYKYDRVYSGTGTVYDIPTVSQEPEVRRRKEPKPEIVDTNKNEKGLVIGKYKIRVQSVLKASVFVGVLFIMCMTLLYRYGAIIECNHRISDLEKERDAIISTNQAIQTRIDKQLEISEIEKYAKEELGMMKPEPYQMFYIDMQMQDAGGEGSGAKSGSGKVKGAPGALVNAFRVLK